MRQPESPKHCLLSTFTVKLKLAGTGVTAAGVVGSSLGTVASRMRAAIWASRVGSWWRATSARAGSTAVTLARSVFSARRLMTCRWVREIRPAR